MRKTRSRSRTYSSPVMYGIPEDGTGAFIMAILDGPGNPEERAREIWKQSAHRYTQKLLHYEIKYPNKS